MTMAMDADTENKAEVLNRLLVRYQAIWGLATLEATFERLVFELSDEGAQRRIDKALNEIEKERSH